MSVALVNVRPSKRRLFWQVEGFGQIQEELLSGLWFAAAPEVFLPFSKCSGVWLANV